jgi:regulatory protein
VRERAAAEVAARLEQEGYEPSVVAAAVARAQAAGLIDDARFTEIYIRQKQAAGWGQRKIEDSLRRLGIDLTQAEGYPEAFFASADDELTRATAALNRYHTRAKDVYSAQLRHLTSKGFSFSIAKQAIAQQGQ